MKYTGDEIGPAKVDSEHYSNFTDTLIPLFKRIRIVTILMMEQCTMAVTSSNEKVFPVHIKDV